MDVKKVQVAIFALKNKLRGYQLLQNPKEASPYQVKMVKRWSSISADLDRYDYYYTKSRDFSKPEEKTEKQTLLVDRLMFWKDEKDKKVVKEKYYNKEYANGGFFATNRLSTLTADEILNRDTSYINKKRRKGYKMELIPMLFIPIEQSVIVMESIADKELSKFFQQKHEQMTKRNVKSFWTVLKNNLQNK